MVFCAYFVGTVITVSPEFGACLLKFTVLINRQCNCLTSVKQMTAQSRWILPLQLEELVCSYFLKIPFPQWSLFSCSKCKLTKPELVFCSLPGNHFDALSCGKMYLLFRKKKSLI